MISLVGLGLLYIALGTDPDPNARINNVLTNREQAKWFFIIMGGFLFAGSFWATADRYLNGVAYYRISRAYTDDVSVEEWQNYHNGLIVSINNIVTLLRFNHDQIDEDGCVRVHTNYNRKKEETTWYITGGC